MKGPGDLSRPQQAEALGARYVRPPAGVGVAFIAQTNGAIQRPRPGAFGAPRQEAAVGWVFNPLPRANHDPRTHCPHPRRSSTIDTAGLSGFGMTFFEKAERVFFEEAPNALRLCALAIVALGLIGGIALGFGAKGGFAWGHLAFAIVALVPAALCLALSYSISARHVSTVPLTALLCLISGMIFIRDPSSVAEGMTPYLPIMIGASAVMLAEIILSFLILAFVLNLWFRGKFR